MSAQVLLSTFQRPKPTSGIDFPETNLIAADMIESFAGNERLVESIEEMCFEVLRK